MLSQAFGNKIPDPVQILIIAVFKTGFHNLPERQANSTPLLWFFKYIKYHNTDKKKTKFSSYIGKSRREWLQSHV
jgi:hypothetical protein